MILKLLTFLGALALFLYGMRMMSNGLQKLTAKGTRKFIPLLTSDDKFRNVAGGFGLTAAVQSSNAATLMVVNFVNNGLMSFRQAVSSIMGANIATPLTVWIIAFLQYTCHIGSYAYIVVAAGFLLKGNDKVKEIGNMLIGIGIMFVALSFVQSSAEGLWAYNSISDGITSFGSHGFLSVLGFVIAGFAVAAIFQSSSVTIILAMILLTSGYINFANALGTMIGANIGTTLLANLSVSNASSEARQAARVHLWFNISIAVIVLALFIPFKALMSLIPSEIYGICIAHTLFNVAGTMVLIWFVDKIAGTFFKPKQEITPVEDLDKVRLKYVTGRSVGAPGLSIALAYREAVNFGLVCYEGFSYIPMALNEKNTDNFEHARKKLVEYEEITDKMESGIAEFLGGFKADELTPEENGEIKILYRVIGELESLGDSGENISRILQRTNIHNIQFDSNTNEKLNNMIGLVEKALSVMNNNLLNVGTHAFNITAAEKAEDKINELRDKYRNEAINNLESTRENYQSINYFLDLLSEFEAMGDFIINISQSLDKQFN